MEKFVIIGAGHAGCQLAFSLREYGFAGAVQLVNGENTAPYHRPPLSKEYLNTGMRDEMRLRGDAAFEKSNIEQVFSMAKSISRLDRTVTLQNGYILQYDHLVLATGTINRKLNIAGGDDGVHYLKNLHEAEALRAGLSQSRRVAIVGAGFIGLEVAASAARMGLQVTVIDIANRVMARAVSSEMSAFFLARHQAAGIRFRLMEGVSEISRNDTAITGLRLQSGEQIEADLILAGLGVIPDTHLAQQAGLDMKDGVLVDQHLASSDPHISAIGDCARFKAVFASEPARLESIQNANDQARCVARRLCGEAQVYDALPWFWSHQGNDKLQIAGLAENIDLDVMRGNPEAGKFSIYRFKAGQLAVVESVNDPAEHMLARRLVKERREIDPEWLKDKNFSIKSLLIPKAVVSV